MRATLLIALFALVAVYCSCASTPEKPDALLLGECGTLSVINAPNTVVCECFKQEGDLISCVPCEPPEPLDGRMVVDCSEVWPPQPGERCK